MANFECGTVLVATKFIGQSLRGKFLVRWTRMVPATRRISWSSIKISQPIEQSDSLRDIHPLKVVVTAKAICGMKIRDAVGQRC